MLVERRAAVGRLNAALSELEGRWKRFRASDAEAEEVVRRARQALESAEIAREKLADTNRSEALRIEAGIRRERGLLIDGADPSIEAFINELRELADETRRSEKHHARYTKNAYGRRMVTAVTNNHASVERRVLAISEAMVAAEALQVQACSDVARALEEIRSSIPEVEVETFIVEPPRLSISNS